MSLKLYTNSNKTTNKTQGIQGIKYVNCFNSSNFPFIIECNKASSDTNNLPNNKQSKSELNGMYYYVNQNKTSGNLRSSKEKNHNNLLCNICQKYVSIRQFNVHVSRHPSQILPWLYLGGYNNAINLQELSDIGINYILNCAIECKNAYPTKFKYLHLKINDVPSFPIKSFFNQAVNFISEAQKNNRKILVHCQLGVSRSVTIVAAFLMKKFKFRAIYALEFVKRRRMQAMPNYGFLNQLAEYEKKCVV